MHISKLFFNYTVGAIIILLLSQCNQGKRTDGWEIGSRLFTSDTVINDADFSNLSVVYLNSDSLIQLKLLVSPFKVNSDSISILNELRTLSENRSGVVLSDNEQKSYFFAFKICNISEDTAWKIQMWEHDPTPKLYRLNSLKDSLKEVDTTSVDRKKYNYTVSYNFDLNIKKHEKSIWVLSLKSRDPFQIYDLYFSHTVSKTFNNYKIFSYAVLSLLGLIFSILLVYFFVLTKDLIYALYLIFLILVSCRWIVFTSNSFDYNKYGFLLSINYIITYSIFCFSVILYLQIRAGKTKFFYWLIFFLAMPLLLDYFKTHILWVGINYSFLIPIFSSVIILFCAFEKEGSKRIAKSSFLFVAFLLILPTVTYFLSRFFPRFDFVLVYSYAITYYLFVVALIIKFISQKRRMDKRELNKALSAERNLSEKVITVLEEERKRIAEDLHDDLGGTLAALRINVENLSLHNETLQPALSMIDNASQTVRIISHNLMPPRFKETETRVLLEEYFYQLNKEAKIHFKFNHIGSNIYFSKEKELMIYRIVMELTNNALKHSHASEVNIQLLFNHTSLRIVYEDNGIGFLSARANGLGIQNIRSRVVYLDGTCVIDSNNKGSTIIISLPFNNKKDDAKN